MKYALWMALALLLFVIGCGGKDPVIGRWSDAASSGFTIDVKADNTITFDVDLEKVLDTMHIAPGAERERTKKMIQGQLSGMTGTWKKTGTLYTVTMSNKGSINTSYMKIENDQLINCDKDGKPLGSRKLVRMK